MTPPDDVTGAKSATEEAWDEATPFGGDGQPRQTSAGVDRVADVDDAWPDPDKSVLDGVLPQP